ncbi:MAG: hypothetical protein WC450_04480 [Candidatus Omnitrophota bacterium]|jgi:hypothetical protein
MPHALLVFEKDLRRFRLILLSWVGVVGMTQGVALLGGTLFSTQLTFRIILPLVLQFLAALQAVLIFIFVPLIVQIDPTVGTTAFWFTRPISRLSLLRAKAVLVGGIFIALPLLLEMAVLALNGLGGNDVLPAALLIVLEKSALVVPVFLMASVTEKFHKFVLAGMTAGLGVVVVWSLMPVLVSGLFSGGALSGGAGQNRFLIPMLAPASLQQELLIIFVSAFLIGHQYKTRRTGRTVLGVLTGVLFIPVALGVLPHGFFKKEVGKINPSQVVIQAGQATVAEDMVSGNRLTRDRVVSLPIQVRGLRPGQFTVLRSVSAPLIVYGPDVKLRSSVPLSPSRILLSSRQLLEPIQYALKDFIVLNPYPGADNSYAILRLPETVYDQYQKQRGTYDGLGLFDVYEYRVGARMPLIRGVKHFSGRKETVILDVIEKPSGVTVIVGEKSVDVSSAFSKEAVPAGEDTSSDFTGTYVLAHPARKEAFLIDIVDQPGIRIDLAWPSAAGRLLFKVKRYDFSSLNTGGSATGFQKSWLKGAELIRLEARKLGAFQRDLRFSGFILPEVNELRK